MGLVRGCVKKLEGSMESVSGMGFCLGFISLPRIWILVFKDDGLSVSNGCCFGRWVMPEETANLRQSRNASRMPFGHALSSRLKPLDNRSPIHPRLAPLKSRGAGGLLFWVRCDFAGVCVVRVLYTQLIYVFQAYLFPQLYCGVRVFQGIRGCGALPLTIQGN